MDKMMRTTSKRYPRRSGGFTIVELLIVIVVIAILASISIVAYNGIQNRTQDVRTRAVAGQIVKAFQAWSVTSGKTTSIGGSGSLSYTDGACVGGSGGWFSRAVSSYPCTNDRVLVDAGAIPPDLVYSVPSVNKNYSGTPPAYTNFMLYRCGSDDRWVFLYALNTVDEKEITAIKTACTGSPTGSFGAIDMYGMGGGIIFNPQAS